jgi:hypothetical protein
MGGLATGGISCRNPRKNLKRGFQLMRKAGASEDLDPFFTRGWYLTSGLPGVTNRKCALQEAMDNLRAGVKCGKREATPGRLTCRKQTSPISGLAKR